MIRNRVHLALAAWLAVAATVWLGVAFAADRPVADVVKGGGATGDESPLRYRRILVPEARIDDVLSKVRKYLSVQPEEFQRLIERARPARIVEAKYRAQLLGEIVLVGTAQLEVECPEGQQAGLSLEGCGLTIDRPRWLIDGDEKEALLGMDAQGRLVAAVDRSARLTFSWSLRGTKDAAGVVRFPIQLPSSPASHFQCDLPAGKTLQASQGVLEVGADGRPTSKFKPKDGEELWAWQVELGSANRLSLQVASDDVIRQRKRLTLVRQHSVYRVSARGVVLTTTLNLDVHNEALRHISLSLEPLVEHKIQKQRAKKQGAKKQPGAKGFPLQLVSARYGDSDIPWSVETRNGKASLVRLQLPEPIQGTDRVLTLQATCPLPSRLRHPWRLPRIRSENTFWQEGTAQVILAAPLFLEAASADLGRQTPSLSGDTVAFEFFSPDAGIDVLVDRDHGPVEVRSGSAIEIGPARIACRFRAQISCQRGSHFELAADVPLHWVVDSVGPPAVIRRWHRDRATGRLVLKLNRAITPQQRLDIVIGGHRASSSEALGIDELRFVKLPGATVRRRLVAIEAAPSYQLKLTGAEALTRLEPQSLGTDARLFDETLNGSPRRLLFEAGEGAERLGVTWVSQSPSFDASVSVDANLRGHLLKETYRIRCTPSDSQVARLRVRFSHARTTPLRWSLVGGHAEGLGATRISNAVPGNRRLSLQGDTWELTLPRATSLPFEIVATRASSLQETLSKGVAAPLSLASLPQASSQQAELTIRCGKPVRLRVNHDRLTAIPVTPAADGEFQTVRAKFTYDPKRETAAVDSAIEISSTGDPGRQPLAWVWSSFHQSRFSIQGDVEHLATFHIQNTGREQMTLLLSDATTRHTLWINHQQQTPVIDGNRLTLNLPEGQKFPTVTLHYTTKGSRLAVSKTVHADLVKVDDIPQLHQRWQAWIPPGYEVFSNSPLRRGDISREVTWSQRLFGPLGRETQRQAFDPLDSEAWARLVRQPEEQATARLRTDQLLRAVGTPPAGEQRWGDLLTFAQSAPSGSSPALLIDWRALSRLGLSSSAVVARRPLAEEPLRANASGDGTRVPAAVVNDVQRMSLGMSTFKAAHLVLLVHPNAIVLSTRDVAAKYRQSMIALEGECVYWVPPGRLRNRLQQAAPTSETTISEPGYSLVDLSTWKTVPTAAALPWDSVERNESLAEDHVGWTAYEFDLSDGIPPPSLHVVHRTSMRSLGWALTILVIVAWWWLARVFEEKSGILAGMANRIRALGAKLRTSPRLLRWWPTRPMAEGNSASDSPDSSGSPDSFNSFGSSGIVLPCLALGLFGAIAMLAPAGLAPMTSALFLGTLVAVLLRPLAKHVRTEIKTKTTESTISVTSLAGVAFWITAALLIGALVGTTAAQQPSDGPISKTAPTPPLGEDATARPVPQVFVPVDDQRRPAGEVWLSKAFYDALRRREANQTGRPRQWLWRNARYRGALHWKAGEPTQLKSLRVEMELWTFAANTTVQVAIRRDLIDSMAAPASLDGDPVRLRWNAAGDVATFDVGKAERHQLIVPLRPRVDRDAAADVSQFDMPIPALASSVVQLDAPSQISSIEAPSALGAVQYDKDKNQFSAVLGATDRLKIRWSARPHRDPTPPQFNVEELLWLTVRPNSVMVEAQFHVEVTKGRLRSLEFEVDERLRLLPSNGLRWPVKNVTFHEGGRSSMRLELSRPVHDAVDIHVRFLLTGASGVGELRQPTLDLIGARSRRRWLAVSVDPGLEFNAGVIDRAIRPISPDDFLGKWGDQETSPRLAYQMPRGQVPWSLKTRSRAPTTTADETLTVSLRYRRASLRYSALLTNDGGTQFQYRLRVPRQMTIDRLRVQQAGVDRATRWTVDDRGSVVVFLIGPVTGPQRLMVEGHMETPGRGTWKVPSIQVEGNSVFAKKGVDVQVASRRVAVYRRPGMLVSIDRVEGLRRLPQDPSLPMTAEAEDIPGRLVARFEKKKGREHLQLSLAPNQPDVKASQLTTLDQKNDQWSVRLDFHVDQIADGSGVVDVLRFVVPEHWDDWEGSLEVSPPAQVSLEKQPGETSQQLVVRPAQAIDGPFHLIVKGLTLAKGQRVELPDIVPLGIDKLRRFVALPETIAGQPIQWERQDLGDLSNGDLPAQFRDVQQQQANFTHYEVNDARPQAIRRPAQKKSDDRLVRLMDVTIAWQANGFCKGTVLYDLEPAGMTDVRLKMPPGYRLVAARVGGLDAGARSENETIWRIPLTSAQLPQRIEVTFTGRITPGNIYQPDFEAPRLLQIGVERTLWTVYSPPSVGVGKPQDMAHQSTALAHAESRLRSLSNLIEEEAPVVVRSSPEHLAAWYRPWAIRLIAARRELRRQQLTATDGQAPGGNDRGGNDRDSNDGDGQAEREFDARQAQISSQIRSILNDPSLQAPTARDPIALWRLDVEDSQIATRCAFVGEARELSLHYAPAPQGDLAGRVAVALLMLTFSAAVVWIVRRGFSIPSPIRWSHALAVAFGIAWWLWLSPSLLGGLIVVCAVVLAVWPLRRRARRRPWALRPAR